MLIITYCTCICSLYIGAARVWGAWKDAPGPPVGTPSGRKHTPHHVRTELLLYYWLMSVLWVGRVRWWELNLDSFGSQSFSLFAPTPLLLDGFILGSHYYYGCLQANLAHNILNSHFAFLSYIARIKLFYNILYYSIIFFKLYIVLYWYNICRYFTEWALTLFSRGFSFDLVTRVWDVLMTEGSYKIVYRVSLGMLKVRYLYIQNCPV